MIFYLTSVCMELVTSNGNAEYNGIYFIYLVNNHLHKGSQLYINSARNSLSCTGGNKIIPLKKHFYILSLNESINKEISKKCDNIFPYQEKGPIM